MSITFIGRDGEEQTVQAKIGDSLLDVSKEYNIDVEGWCLHQSPLLRSLIADPFQGRPFLFLSADFLCANAFTAQEQKGSGFSQYCA